MVIETKRLILRNYKEDDIDDYFEYMSQPNIGPSCGWKPYTTKEQALKSLKEEIKKPYLFAIVLKENNKAIGTIKIDDLENNEKFPFLSDINNIKEVNFLLDEGYWNKGYMTEALEVLIATSFEVLNYEAIVASNFEPNGASARVQEKCNMKFMGKLKDYATWYKTNEKCDLVLHMITKEEYNKNKTEREIEVMK